MNTLDLSARIAALTPAVDSIGEGEHIAEWKALTRKQAVTDALRAFLRQRPGLEWVNYGSTASYQAESRRITRDLRHAMELLRAVELRSIPAESMLGTHGRLTVGPRIDWTAGQYWPVEYRAGVARYLAGLLWDHWRECGCSTAEKIRAEASRSLSRAVVARFFR